MAEQQSQTCFYLIRFLLIFVPAMGVGVEMAFTSLHVFTSRLLVERWRGAKCEGRDRTGEGSPEIEKVH